MRSKRSGCGVEPCCTDHSNVHFRQRLDRQTNYWRTRHICRCASELLSTLAGTTAVAGEIRARSRLPCACTVRRVGHARGRNGMGLAVIGAVYTPAVVMVPTVELPLQ